MRALGFNVVRLVLNWSQLEPTAGNYSTSFVNRVAQVVSWARQQGIYVILDMHQDQYSRYILPSKPATTPAGCKPSGGSDGAPPWAVMSDGKPGCALAGIDELNPAEAAAFSNFWTNVTVPSPKGSAPGPGLEDHYIGAMAALAHRFESDPAVLGYEIMNEPQPGSTADLPVANAYQSSAQELYPFYTRAIEALTGVRDGKPTCPATSPTSLSGACAYPQLANVSRQQIFFEPLAYRNLVDFSMQVSAPFSSYKNLVFAPHVYTYAFTIEQELLGAPPGGGGYPPNFTFGYQTAESEAQAMHAAVFSTEFGDSASTDKTIVSKEVAAQEATLTGGTLWAWKGLSKQAATCWCVRWQFSTYETTSNGTAGVGDPHTTPSPDDRVIASRQITMDRVWPRATAGLLGAYRYDPAGRSFAMVASAVTSVHRGDRAAETVVYIPATVDGAVAAAGNATLDVVLTQPDGSRLAYVAPEIPSHKSPASGARFTYTVTVGHATSALRNSVAQAAADPPPPIAEPQARALSEQALHAALTSTNPKIRSTAQLVNVLAGLVLGSTDPNDPGSTPAG
jgi:endoglycosylceramidase